MARVWRLNPLELLDRPVPDLLELIGQTPRILNEEEAARKAAAENP